MTLYDGIRGEFAAAEMDYFATLERNIRATKAAAGIPEDSVDRAAARSGIGFAGQQLAASYLGVSWAPKIFPTNVPAPKHTFEWRGQRVEVKTRSQSNYKYFVLKDWDTAAWDILICVSPITAKVYLDYVLMGWLTRDEYFAVRERHPERPSWWINEQRLHPMATIWDHA